MAGFGWYPGTAGPGLEVSGDGQTATRPTDGGGGSYAAMRGVAGRNKGKRYFEIDAGATCSVGVVDTSADLEGALGGGASPLQWGFLLSDGYLYFNQQGGSGSTNKSTGTISPSIMGILIDFDAHRMTVYADGVELFTQALSFAVDTVLYPAVSLGTGDSATLNTTEPFDYPPAVSYVPWDKSDLALGSKVSGTILIEGAPAARLVKAFSYERQPFSVNNQPVTESKPLGQSISDPVTGEYEIILRDGFPRAVFVTAFDDYGRDFEADAAITTGERVHPTTPTGYVYDCTGAGDLPSTEPDPWPTDTEASHLIGTASFDVKPFYRPQVHGPVVPDAVDIDISGAFYRRTLAASSTHQLAVSVTGEVLAWGGNSQGETAVPAGLDNVVSVAAGSNFSLALKADGTVVGWGYNGNGETSIPAGLDDVVQIAAGRNFGVALKVDGTVVAWGGNNYGQLGINGATGIKQVECGAEFVVCVREDGTMQAAGRNFSGTVSSASSRSRVMQVAAYDVHVVIIYFDGTVAAWGYSPYGQNTVPAGLDNVIEVSTGAAHCLALKADGTVVAWGSAYNGSMTIPAVLNGDAAHVFSGYNMSLCLNRSGDIFAFGQNSSGSVADKPTSDALLNVLASV